jgi:hypothetical protein
MIVLAVIALILSAGVTYLAYRLLAPRMQSAEEMTSIATTVGKLAPGTRVICDYGHDEAVTQD